MGISDSKTTWIFESMLLRQIPNLGGQIMYGYTQIQQNWNTGFSLLAGNFESQTKTPVLWLRRTKFPCKRGRLPKDSAYQEHKTYC